MFKMTPGVFKSLTWRPINMMLFISIFIALFEGIISYIMPLLILEAGLSKTEMGFLIGSASFFGALFDFLLCKYISNAHFRKMYLAMFAAAAILTLILIGAKTLWLFLIIMALWGLYFDFRNFGHWDFIARCSAPSERAANFGLISAVKAIGSVLAPLIAGFLIGNAVGYSPLLTALIFLVVAFMGYLILLSATKNTCDFKPHKHKRKGFLQEIKKWIRLGYIILPVICMTFLLGMIDAFFWSAGPIVAESLISLQNFRGLFLTAYYLPAVFVVILLKPLVKKIGKKSTALYSVILGLLVLSTLVLFENAISIIVVVFVASALFSIAWPANDGVYADFISESDAMEKEVKGMGDFSSNLGYIIGPVIAGILMDLFGNGAAFTALGVGGVAFALFILLITPKSITIPKR